jgi:sugar phosphate isomerase/epimerase
LKQATTSAAAASALAAAARELVAAPLGLPIGSQTYPHRALLKQDFPGLLKQFADLGVQSVELCSPFGYADFAGLADAALVKKTLAEHGLRCESAHFSMRELREDQARSIAWAKQVGITQMITATLGGPRTSPTTDDVKKAADEYNKIAAVAAQAGIQQGLHNEGFEHATTADGQRVYDALFSLLDPKLVKFQFQMSAIRDGLDAAEYFAKHPGRFFSMHLQDWDPQAKATVALGKGSIDWKKVFGAAKAAGVKNYFVEQNWEMTKDSVAFLKTLG